MKTPSRILISTFGALLLSVTATSASTSSRPHWQPVFRADARYGLEGLAMDQRGTSANKWLYTANPATGYLLRLGTGGHYLGRWSYAPPAINPYVHSIVGIAVGGQGNVFVTDVAGNRIEKFYPPFGLINHWGTTGTTPNQFNEPVGTAVDRQGNVYVADKLNSRIQKFSPAGSYITSWPMPWIGSQGNSNPTGIAVGPRGTIFAVGSCPGSEVCNNGHFDSQDVVVRFSPDGRVLGKWVGGTPHNGVGPGEKPWITLTAIAVDGTGNLYATGYMDFPHELHAGVLEFSPTGRLLNRWRGPEAQTLQGTAIPQGIALGANNAIYITQGDQILKLVR